MSVEFDEKDTISSLKLTPEAINDPLQKKGMIGWMMRKGLVKNEFQANVVLLCISCISLGLMMFFLIKFVI